MPAFNINETVLIEGWISNTLFGINIVLYILCVRTLARLAVKGWSSPRFLMMVSTVQIVVCAGHEAVFLAKTIHAYVTLGSYELTTEYLSNQGETLDVVQRMLFIVSDSLGSGVLIWRCFVIWQRSKFVGFFLGSFWVGAVVAGIGATVHLARLTPGLQNLFLPSLAVWAVSFLGLSLITQLASTLLIVRKILLSTSFRPRNVRSSEFFVLRLMVESCAMYSVASIVAMVLFGCRVAAGSVVITVLTQISATAPFTMIVRAHSQTVHTDRHIQDKSNIPSSSGGVSFSSGVITTGDHDNSVVL